MNESVADVLDRKEAVIGQIHTICNQLVERDQNYVERFERSKKVVVEGNEFEIGQTIEVADVKDGEILVGGLAVPSDQEVIEGSWFKDLLESNLLQGRSTTLWICINDFTRLPSGSGYKGTLWIPQKDAISDVSNIVLFNPFENKCVAQNETSYESTWTTVTSWVLNELDSPDNITHLRAWIRWPDQQADGLMLLDVSKNRQILTTNLDSNDNTANKPVEMLVWDPLQSRNLIFSFSETDCSLIDTSQGAMDEPDQEIPLADVSVEQLEQVLSLVRGV